MFFAAVLAIMSSAPPRLAADALMQPGALGSALEHGEYVIFVATCRHRQSKEDQPDLDLADCNTQRVLTRKGRMNARAIGQAVDQLKIPIGEVISSPPMQD